MNYRWTKRDLTKIHFREDNQSVLEDEKIEKASMFHRVNIVQDKCHEPKRGAGNEATGTWYCPNCGCANSNLTPNHCPICGWRR